MLAPKLSPAPPTTMLIRRFPPYPPLLHPSSPPLLRNCRCSCCRLPLLPKCHDAAAGDPAGLATMIAGTSLAIPAKFAVAFPFIFHFVFSHL